jgi:hypothetical protein
MCYSEFGVSKSDLGDAQLRIQKRSDTLFSVKICICTSSLLSVFLDLAVVRRCAEDLRQVLCLDVKPLLTVMPYLRRLLACFLPQRSGFEPASSHVGSVVDIAAMGQVSFEHFGFPCHSFVPLIAPKSSPSIIQGCYNRLINGRSNSGLGSTQAP